MCSNTRSHPVRCRSPTIIRSPLSDEQEVQDSKRQRNVLHPQLYRSAFTHFGIGTADTEIVSLLVIVKTSGVRASLTCSGLRHVFSHSVSWRSFPDFNQSLLLHISASRLWWGTASQHELAHWWDINEKKKKILLYIERSLLLSLKLCSAHGIFHESTLPISRKP